MIAAAKNVPARMPRAAFAKITRVLEESVQKKGTPVCFVTSETTMSGQFERTITPRRLCWIEEERVRIERTIRSPKALSRPSDSTFSKIHGKKQSAN
jgi:hypothetical protein